MSGRRFRWFSEQGKFVVDIQVQGSKCSSGLRLLPGVNIKEFMSINPCLGELDFWTLDVYVDRRGGRCVWVVCILPPCSYLWVISSRTSFPPFCPPYVFNDQTSSRLQVYPFTTFKELILSQDNDELPLKVLKTEVRDLRTRVGDQKEGKSTLHWIQTSTYQQSRTKSGCLKNLRFSEKNKT